MTRGQDRARRIGYVIGQGVVFASVALGLCLIAWGIWGILAR